MNIVEILKNNPELAPYLNVTAKATDLMELAKLCIETGRQEKPEPEKKEKLRTAGEITEEFNISDVTLWTWDKKKITKPVYIGKRKYYKQSDIEKMISNG